MANTKPSSAQPTEALFANLRDIGTARELGVEIIAELKSRDVSLNQISARTGIPRATVQRWAKTEGEQS